MNIIRTLYIKLPPSLQDKIFERKMKDGSLFRMPVFDMLFRSLGAFGGDMELLKSTVTSGSSRKKPLATILCELGRQTADCAAALEKAGQLSEAGECYRKAALFWFVLDWLIPDEDGIAERYRLALPCFDKFRQLTNPPIEKVCLPFRDTWFVAHYRHPGQEVHVPVVLIIQGNDEIKEFNVAMEELILNRGMAVMNIDPPGWGESWVLGSRCRSKEDYALAISTAIEWLEERAEIDKERIGIMGVSFGGLLAPWASGLDKRIKAACGLGGPSGRGKTNRRLRRTLPAAQKRRGFLLTGTRTEKEILRWYDDMAFPEGLRTGTCPVLLVHGSRDEIVSLKDVRENLLELGKRAELQVIDGGDHMCSGSFQEEVGPLMVDWLKKILKDISVN